MNIQAVRLALSASIISLSLGMTSGVAFAQDSAKASEGGLEDIVVTARKRAESVQDIPVNVMAVSAATIQQQDLTSLEKVAARTPNFQIGRASNGSGAQMTLRGIGSSSTSIGIEQSVAVVVDGVYYGQGRVIQEGFFDLARLEILKGPQALFFGKNATAGVVSLTTADPTDKTEFMARAGYEFKAHQVQLEAIGSGPLSDTLGLRVAVRGSKMYEGYYKNVAPNRTYTTVNIQDILSGAAPTPVAHTAFPASSRAPGEKEFLGRVTLKFTPSSNVTDTLKASYDYNSVNNSSWNYNAFNCGKGTVSQLGGYPCDAGFVSHQNNIPADIAVNFPYSKKDGQLYNRYRSWAVTNNLNIVTDDVTFTSVTGYNTNNNRWACACDFQSSDTGTWATENSTWKAFSQEFRALTTYDGPVNLMVGGLYQKTKRTFEQYIMFAGLSNSAASAQNQYLATTKTSFTNGKTAALFGQVTWKVVPTVELAGGVRYTHETKKSYFTQPYNNPGVTFIFRDQFDPDGLGVVTANQTFNDWSPEATLTWKPTKGIMAYIAYKTAYKSGGFSNGGINSKFSTHPFQDLTFNPEKARGFEAGIKTTLADNQLRLNATVYRFDYKDLQVDFFNSPIFAFQTLTADARTKGVELEFEYAPRDVDGLNLHGSLNYNKATYRKFPFAPCYSGETQAEGCNLVFDTALNGYRTATAAENGQRQSLNGKSLSVAPKWTANIGVGYDREVGSNMKFGFNVDARYSDSYLASAFGNPRSRQKSYVSIDAGVRLGAADDNWQVALLGKNLTNRFFVTGVVDGPSTGGVNGTAGGSFYADQLGFGSLPRTVMLQLTKRF